MRTVADAQRWLERQSRSADPAPTPTGTWRRWCQMSARMAYDVAPLFREADEAWSQTRFRTEPLPAPPVGWFIWWDRGAAITASTDEDAGHVAVSAGNGLCWSTDAKRPGHIDLVRIASITRAWHIPYVGCSRDINGVLAVPVDTRVPEPHRPAPSSGRVLVVRHGDTLSGLVAARPNGRHVTWQDVWRDPHNLGLRHLRGRPDRIRPGDHVWVP